MTHAEQRLRGSRRWGLPRQRLAGPQSRAHPCVHFATPLDRASSFSWIIAQLALAMDAAGECVTVEHRPAKSIAKAQSHELDEEGLTLLRSLRRRRVADSIQVGWHHPWYIPHSTLLDVALVAVNSAPLEVGSARSWLREIDSRIVAAISGFVRDTLIKGGIAAERISLLPLGASYPVVARDASARAGRILAFTTDQSIERLGTDVAIRAFADATRRGLASHLTLRVYSGNGVEAANLVRAAGVSERVTVLTGALTKDELRALYLSCDVVLAPFRGEGFGIKLLDAMVLGVPVVMPYFGGPTDFVTPASAELVPFDLVPEPVGTDVSPDDPKQLWAEPDVPATADALLRVDEDAALRSRLALEAQRVTAPFDWDHSAACLRSMVTRPDVAVTQGL